MDQEKTFEMLDKAEILASVLVLAIGGFFLRGSDADARALKGLANELATIFDELVVATAPASVELVTVELTAIGEKKIEVIKKVRDLTGWDLKEAKDLVEGAPEILKVDVAMSDAIKIKRALEGVGATVLLI
jgi:ribosomal protein L7/L12